MELYYTEKVCRSCSTIFIEHDITIYVLVVLDDNSPTRPTNYRYIINKFESLFQMVAIPTVR